MRISDWSSDVCSSDLHPQACQSARAGWKHARKDRLDTHNKDRHSTLAPVRRLSPHSAFWIWDHPSPMWGAGSSRRRPARKSGVPHRSEEHTSELQSQMRISYAVFCLDKKNIYTKKVYK